MRARSKWLLIALVLFAAVAWLGADPAKRAGHTPAPVEFRHYPTYEERREMVRRRTLPALPTDVVTDNDGDNAERRRDPVLVALPASAPAVLVFEARTFFQMPIGKLLWECMAKDAPDADFGLFDPSRAERIAVAIQNDQPFVVVAGDFKERPRDVLGTEREESYGEHAVIHRERDEPVAASTGTTRAESTAIWKDQLMLFARNELDVRSAIDRLDGTAPSASAVDPNEAYGEAYGRVNAEMLERVLPSSLVEQLEDGDTSFGFHLDATGDALLTVDATGDKDVTQDIAKTLAGALTVLRVKARAEENDALATLLDSHAIRMTGDGFQLEAAFPLDVVQKFLADCGESGSEKRSGGP